MRPVRRRAGRAARPSDPRVGREPGLSLVATGLRCQGAAINRPRQTATVIGLPTVGRSERLAVPSTAGNKTGGSPLGLTPAQA